MCLKLSVKNNFNTLVPIILYISICKLNYVNMKIYAVLYNKLTILLTQDKLCRKGQFWQKLWKTNMTSSKRVYQDISNWSTVEVGIWLESVQLGEYIEVFVNNDIRGKELLNLSRRDLKEIGMTKVGHIKRILMALKELHTVHEEH